MPDLNCLVPLIIIVAVLLATFTIGRRLIFLGDELALFTLMANGLRQVIGEQRFAAGCLMITGLATGTVLFVVLVLISFGSCFTTNPSQFCQAFPFIGR